MPVQKQFVMNIPSDNLFSNPLNDKLLADISYTKLLCECVGLFFFFLLLKSAESGSLKA